MKEVIILVGKDGRPSMKNTYSKLKKKANLLIRRRLVTKRGVIKEWFRSYLNNNSEVFTKLALNVVNFKNKIIIRWGNTIVVDSEDSIVYNNSKAIAKATDKKLSRSILASAGVSVPRAVTPDTENINYPVIARPRRHAKGKNFIVLKNLAQLTAHFNRLNENWYYSEFVDKVSEFRVHCAHGRILNYLQKPNPGNGQIAWNRALNGEAFDNVKWSDYDSKVSYECLKAVQAIGLDFAGVDVIVDSEGNPYILELNTSPTLNSSEYSMSRYAKYFDWLSLSDTKRDHFELTLFKKASNFAWHDYHFEDRKPNN